MTEKPPIPDDVTVGEARDRMRELVMAGESLRCVCCSQNVQLYERTVNVAMARALIAVYAAAGTGWVHVPTVVSEQGGDLASRLGGQFGKLAYWKLVEEQRVVRPLDGGRAGYWRVTPLGEQWLAGRAMVAKYARVYDGRCLGLRGDLVSIEDALRERFDLRDVRAPAPATTTPDGQLFDMPAPTRGHHHEAA